MKPWDKAGVCRRQVFVTVEEDLRQALQAHAQPLPTERAGPIPEVTQDVKDFLKRAHLTHKEGKALEWCEMMGLALFNELTKSPDVANDLALALELKPLEHKRFFANLI